MAEGKHRKTTATKGRWMRRKQKRFIGRSLWLFVFTGHRGQSLLYKRLTSYLYLVFHLWYTTSPSLVSLIVVFFGQPIDKRQSSDQINNFFSLGFLCFSFSLFLSFIISSFSFSSSLLGRLLTVVSFIKPFPRDHCEKTSLRRKGRAPIGLNRWAVFFL